jgi:hypothetical protein
MLRAIWDVTFARQRMGFQPPFTPLLIPAVSVMIAASLRDIRARCMLFVCAGYLAVFSWLPQDSRYLVPLLPLVSIGALYPERGRGSGGSEGSGGHGTVRSHVAVAARSFAPTQPSALAQDKVWCAVAARSFAPAALHPSLRIKLLPILAFAPGLLYAAYTLALHGMPPLTPTAREPSGVHGAYSRARCGDVRLGSGTTELLRPRRAPRRRDRAVLE